MHEQPLATDAPRETRAAATLVRIPALILGLFLLIL